MRNKRFAVLAMAAIMAASSAMPVMADDAAVEIETNDETSENQGGGHEGTHITGDVSTSGENKSGISAVETTITVDGNVTGGLDGVDACDSEVTVGGNVTSEKGAGIDAANSKVTAGGDVTGSGTGIKADNSEVTVGGNVTSDEGDGIYAKSSEVTVGGDATGKARGIYANDSKVTAERDVTGEFGGITAIGSDIIVKGDVTAKGEDHDIAIAAWDSSNVMVGGDVTGGDGVAAKDGSNVSIKGSVKATGEEGMGIFIAGTEKTTVVVEGDVTANGVAMDVADNENANSEVAVAGKIGGTNGTIINVSVDNSGKVNTLPEIVVGEITDFDNITVKDYRKGDDVSEDVKKEVLDSIKYIVGTDNASMNGKGTISITKVNGSALDKDGLGRFDVAKASETITVHINVQEGYEVSEVRAGKATLTRNADGTYSVTVPAGGGVNIEALVRAIEKDNADKNGSDNSNNNYNISSNNTNESDGSDYSVYTESVTSVWNSNGNNWTYTKADGSKAQNEWLQIVYKGKQHWYYFGADMNMSTGLFTDAQGHQYYLNPEDGELIGTMVTGWVEINGKWYFFNDGTIVDLPEGCLVEGMTR